ncbi:MAG: tetratricopeptide repeat protein [Sphingomonadales bacterium]
MAPAAWADAFEDGVIAYDQGRYGEAKVHFELLIESGHSGAEAMLGIMYFNGQGVVKDRFIAAIWFYKGARRGNPSAQLAYGSLYFNGVGVRPNPVTAYTWITLAEKNGEGQVLNAARLLKAQIAAVLSEDQRRKAEAKVAAWKPVWPGN